MKNDRLYVDIHILQTVPPSCVNRDDTGSPKTAIYGGATRARISSQSWKHAIRVMFKELFPDNKLGMRTKKIVEMVAKEISNLNMGANSEELAQRILKAAGLKIKDDNRVDALFFMSTAQAKALAELAVGDSDTVKEKPTKESKLKVLNALKQFPGIDIALFGRMVADEPTLNTDACAQVAHSISTHSITNEYDYFTALDDFPDEDSAGASHIGTVEFNSSTLYRYATVAVHKLHKQLDNDTVDAVKQFVYAFVHSMPTGKQNTFANRTLPDAVLVTVRENQPINLVGAFEKPIPATDEGYVVASAKRLVDHAKNTYVNYAQNPTLSLVIGETLAELGKTQPLNELLEVLAAKLLEILESGEK
jgi:CRISPR system Cascade subunit CasC